MSDYNDCTACHFGHDRDCRRGKEIDQMQERIAALERELAEERARLEWWLDSGYRYVGQDFIGRFAVFGGNERLGDWCATRRAALLSAWENLPGERLAAIDAARRAE